MKNFLLLSFLILTVSSTDINDVHNNRFLINEIIRQIFEIFRKVIISGNLERNIPVLDPYQFEYKEIEIEGNVFSIRSNVSNGILTGLGGFKLLRSDFNKSEISLALDITFPELKFTAERYKMFGNIFNALPIAGKGRIQIEVHDFRFWSKIYLKQSEDKKSVLFDTVKDPQFDMKRIVSLTQFDNNIDEILNAMIGDLLANYLNRLNKVIAAAGVESFIGYINPILNKFDTWKYIAAIINAY